MKAEDEAEPPFSVLDHLQRFEWSTEESVAYEAAVEAINAAVGAYTARITTEQAKPQPDAAVIEDLRRGRRDCEAARRALDPADHERIATARRRYSRLAEELGQSGPGS